MTIWYYLLVIAMRTVYCGRCGSINLVRTRSSAMDKVVRFVTGKKRVTCKRCLWTTRMRWDHEDDYVPKMLPVRPVPPSAGQSAKRTMLEEDFDINRFH